MSFGRPLPDQRCFITFEGIDCAGKSTQARLFHERLLALGKPCILLRDPGTTELSEHIRHILLHRDHVDMSPWTELLLYEAARAQMVHESIIPALSEGKTVISDRFFDSTTAYQGYGRQLDLTIVEIANKIGSIDVIPDMTFYIDVEPNCASKRKEKSRQAMDRMEAEGIELQKRVRNGFLRIAEQNAHRFIVIDGHRSIATIHADVWHRFSQTFLNA